MNDSERSTSVEDGSVSQGVGVGGRDGVWSRSGERGSMSGMECEPGGDCREEEGVLSRSERCGGSGDRE